MAASTKSTQASTSKSKATPSKPRVPKHQAELDKAAKVLAKAAGPMHNRDIARAVGITTDPGFSQLYAAMKGDERFVFRPKVGDVIVPAAFALA